MRSVAFGAPWVLALAACANADPQHPGAEVDAAVDAALADSSSCIGQAWYQPVEMTCDGIDNDCDGTRDNVASPPIWFRDRDGDGHGDAGMMMGACNAPAGYVASSDDCDDGSGYVHPGRAEVCDGLDNDCSTTTGDGCGNGCVIRTRAVDDRRYLFCGSSLSWTNAQAYCAAQSFRLVRVDNTDENTWLRTTANAAIGSGYFWIGGTDGPGEGVWRWDDGAQFWQGPANGTAVGGLFENWEGPEPNDSGGEDCTEMRNGEWNDEGCGDGRPFVCERY